MLPQVDPELAAPVAQASATTPLADLKREVERILSPRKRRSENKISANVKTKLAPLAFM
jgi:hypothetical protein